MERYDTIVVGAGVAGCALGCQLAAQGERVLVLERLRLDGKRKLCGGLVTAAAYELLIEAFGPQAAALPWMAMERFEVRCGAVGLQRDGRGLRSVPRQALDAFAAERLRASGAMLWEDARVGRIDVRAHELDVGQQTLSWGRLVGADGASSQVRRALAGRGQQVAIAVESFAGPTSDPLLVEGVDGVRGYAYEIPNAEGTILGLASVVARPDLRDAFQERFGAQAAATARAGVLPTGGDVLLGKGDVLLAGDAAGLAAPLSGEGIRYALSSALAASRSESVAAYRRAMRADLARLRSERLLSHAIYNERLRHLVFRRCGTSRLARSLVSASAARVLG